MAAVPVCEAAAPVTQMQDCHSVPTAIAEKAHQLQRLPEESDRCG